MQQTMRSVLYQIFTDDEALKRLVPEAEYTDARGVFIKEAAKRKEYIVLDDTNKEAYFTKHPPQPSLEDTLDNFTLIL